MTSSTIKIMVDIDGVLARVSSYLSALNTLTGLRYQEQDITYYSAICDLYGQQAADLVFSSPDIVFEMGAHCGNVWVVREWTKYFDVYILTARPMAAKEATTAWLEQCQVGRAVRGVHFEDKIAWAEANRPTIMIDDCAEILIKASSYVQIAYLVNRPWNAGIPGPFCRVDNLKEIMV